MKPIHFLPKAVLSILVASTSVSLTLVPKSFAVKPLSSPQGTHQISQLIPQPEAQRLYPPRLVQALDRQDIPDAIRQVELGWKKQFEEYYRGQLTSQYLELDQMQHSLNRLHRLTRKKTALVYAIPVEEHLELILVTPTGKPLHRRIQAASQSVLLETAQSFRSEIANPISRSKKYLQPAKQLYDWLILPLEPTLQAEKIDTLIFCLGSGLRSLPMAALHNGQQFLVEKYSLAIIPAFNLLDQHPAVLQGVQVLAMGASEFESEPPLPAVPTELSAIADSLWSGQSLLNQKFTLANLKAERAKIPYGIVHLATHANFLPGSVDESYIQFWNEKLRLHQFRQLGLRIPIVQLLVLSACTTALGNTQAELGFAGLAVQSGSKAALASLWPVHDAGTLVLMTRFYDQLKTSPIKAEALRQAQLAMLKRQTDIDQNLDLDVEGKRTLPPEVEAYLQGNFSHPYYWAAFTMIGNPW